MTGRAREFARLIEAFEQARRGSPGVVILEGEAGCGKTRLLGEFLHWVGARGADTLHASAWNSAGSLSYQPIVDALRPRVELERAPDDLLSDVWLVELSRLLPELHDRYPDLPLPIGDDAAVRGRLFEAVARLLQALAERAPVVVVVDDAERSDAATRDLLQYVLRRARHTATSLLLVLALGGEADGVSSNGAAEWIGRLRRDLHARSLTIGPLEVTDVLGLVVGFAAHSSTDGDDSASPALTTRLGRRLWETTEGYPGAIAGVLAGLRERRALAWDGKENTWRLDLEAAFDCLAAAPQEAVKPAPPAPPTPSFISASAPELSAAKLRLPAPRPNLVLRPQLAALFDQGLQSKLILVSAAAGYGKTVALSAWLGERGLAANMAWVSLDQADNDPLRFWSYLLAAIDSFAPGVAAPARGALHAGQTPGALLTALLNSLSTLPGDHLLALDDYHLIETAAIHEGLTFLLDHLPPRLHLAIATRCEPPLPLARLRARGQVCEIHTRDLRFNADETTTFLQQTMGLSLAPEALAALHTRTEGWVVGLQLAAHALRGHEDPNAAATRFGGNHRSAQAYFVDEVVATQPLHLQHFLLRTSILQRMCVPLCDAVLGLEPGHDASRLLLEQLERDNVFTIALDDGRRWYRYHRLFGETLRDRLYTGAQAREIAALHRRAAAWYEAQGLAGEASRHALAAGSFDGAGGTG